MSKKILITTNIFFPAIGGHATLSDRLARGLVEKGYNVRLLCAWPNDGTHHDSDTPYKIIRCGTRGNRIRRELSQRLSLAKNTLWADKVFIVGLEYKAAQIAQKLKTPYILRFGGDSVWESARNLGLTDTLPSEFYNQNINRSAVSTEEKKRLSAIKKAQHIIAVSDYIKKLITHWNQGINTDIVFVIPNGIPQQFLSKDLTQRQHSEPLKLLFAGRIVNWKGADTELLAISKIQDKNITLSVIGDGPEYAALKHLTAQLGLNNRVSFQDSVSPENLFKIMKEHHALLLPSLYEGMSNTILEAGANGLPVIVTQNGANEEIITDRETGLLIPCLNPDALAKAIVQFDQDENFRQALAQNLNNHIRTKFMIDHTIEQTIHLIEKNG